MSGWTCQHCSSVRWAQQLRLAHQVRSYASAVQSSTVDERPKRYDPTPAQTVRFAVTGTTKVPKSGFHDNETDAYLKKRFAEPEIPRTLIFNQPRSQFLLESTHLSQISSLDELHTAIQRHVNTPDAAIRLTSLSPYLRRLLRTYAGKAQYIELLAATTAILERLQKWKLKDLTFFFLGLQFAIRAFSPAAIRQYIDIAIRTPYRISLKMAKQLIKDLAMFYRYHLWECPGASAAQMLEAVTGIGSDGSRRQSLYSLISWDRNEDSNRVLADYVLLLGLMGDKVGLPELWSGVEERLGSDKTPSFCLLISAFLRAFLSSGSTKAAFQATKKTAGYIDINDVVPLDLWRNLLEQDISGELKDLPNGKTTMSLLQQDICSIEAKLGVKWSGTEDGYHSQSREMETLSEYNPDATQSPSEFRLDDSVPSLETTRQLLEEISTRGPSKSRASLSAIVDLLNENEGLEIPLGSQSDDVSGVELEYAWFPRNSPIEIKNNIPSLYCDMISSPPPSSLGLLRVRPCCDELPLKNGRTLYLMQLGYVGVRTKNSLDGVSDWETTGHIVSWDRMHSTFRILFIGKGYGVIDPGHLPHGTHPHLPYSQAVLLMKALSDYKPALSDILKPSTRSYGYLIDVDPAHDLHT